MTHAAALAPLLEQLVQLLLAALLALGTLAARRLADWLRLSADGRAREALLDLVALAVDAAQERAEAELRRRFPPKLGLPSPAQDSAAAAAVWSAEAARAAGYVARRMPGAAARLGLDEAALTDMVRQRLQARGMDVA